MKKVVLLILISTLLSSCFVKKITNPPSKIEILGTKLKQKEFCAELGKGNACNPFPYGTSMILQNNRWAFPETVFKEETSKENTEEQIAKQYIGGLIVRDVMPVPAPSDIQENYFKKGWIDIHSGSVVLDIKDTIMQKFDVDVSVDNVIKAIMANTSLKDLLTAEKEESIKTELRQKFSRVKNGTSKLDVTYHSIKLNGKWYRALLEKDKLAQKILDTSVFEVPKSITRLKTDNMKVISGMGIIEYKNTTKTKLDREYDIQGLELLSQFIDMTYKNELNRHMIKTVPFKYDLVLVSTLLDNKKYFKCKQKRK